MDNKIENIFFDTILPNMEIGHITIEDIRYFIKFHYLCEQTNNHFDDSFPVLIIKNKKKFIYQLSLYVKTLFKDQTYNLEQLKACLTFLWSNATYEDFVNPEIFIKRHIEFINNPLFEIDKTCVYAKNIATLSNSNIKYKIEKQSFKMETPYQFCIDITDEENSYSLPSISYGITDDNECYIYAIQNNKQNNVIENAYQKRIKRLLYKINDGVFDQESDEYKAYASNKSEYYPENISDVSPSAILSLTIFLNMMRQKNISKIKTCVFLPVRYNSKKVTNEEKSKYLKETKNLSDMEHKKMLLEMEKEQIFIQKNITDKMIRNFQRLNYHFSNIDLSSFPMMSDEYIHISLSDFDLGNNDLLNSVILDEKKKSY